MRGVSKSGMQATVLYLFNALPDIARGGNIPVAFSMSWRMLKLRPSALPDGWVGGGVGWVGGSVTWRGRERPRPSQHQPTTTNQPPRRGGRPRWEPRAKHTLITLKLTPAKILGDTKYLPEYNLSCEKWWSPGEVAGGLSRSRSPPTTQNSYGGQNAVRRHSRELGGENRVVKTT